MQVSFTTTLNRIREHGPCPEGWEKLLRHLGKTGADDEPLPYSVIVASNGLSDALWCCQCEPQHDREWRLFSVWCARQVQHLMTDPRSIAAIDVAERFANGEATEDELTAAQDAAGAAAREATGAAWDAQGTARDAAGAARDAAWAAGNTAWAAAGAAAGNAAGAAWAAGAAGDAAWAAAGNAQTAKFLEIVG